MFFNLANFYFWSLCTSHWLGVSGNSTAAEMYNAMQYQRVPQELYALSAAVAMTESTFNQNAKSHKGAVGVMQVMPIAVLDHTLRTGERLNPTILYDNIRIGTEYLKYLTKRYENGRLIHVLTAYNAGPTMADRLIKGKISYVGLPEETKHYITRVTGYLRSCERTIADNY